MFSFAKNIRKLVHSNYLISHFDVLLHRHSFAVRFLTKTSTVDGLLIEPYRVITSKLAHINHQVENKRDFSKKKGPKRIVETEEESDSDEDQYEQSTGDDEVLSDNIIKKNVSSLRLDNIIKAGLGLTKKKIEQEFYAFKLRLNGKPVVKKAMNVYIGDELDVVKGFSPDTNKYLTVDRIIIKGIDKVTGTGQFPVKMEVLKKLTIENYEEPWNPATVGQLDK